MSYAFGDKLGVGQLPPPQLYGPGHLWFNDADLRYYYHTGVDWEILGVDPTVSNFDTYDDLRNATTPGSPIILVGGRSAAGDGGQGFFIKDPSGRADNDGTILVDADGQSWQRVFTGDVMGVWFFGNDATVSRQQVYDLYDRVYTDHGITSIDWTTITLDFTAPNTVGFDMDRDHVFKHLTVNVNSGALEFRANAPASGDSTNVEFVNCILKGHVNFTTTDSAGSMYVHDSIGVNARIFTYGDSVFADSVLFNSTVRTYANSVFRNNVVRNTGITSSHQFNGSSFIFGNQFYLYLPPYGSAADVHDATRVVNNTFYTYIDGQAASGTVNIAQTDGAVFANNRVYLRRHTYPYVFSLSSPHKATIVGNYFESHTAGGQDATQWTFSADADVVVITGNAFTVRGGSGNYGVRIRGGAKANAVVANNAFMNFGSHGGNGIERRNGTGNLKFIGNVFYNWGYAIRKIGSDTINGVFEGNSNAFSSCGPINDPDYTNTTADTVWN